MPLERTPPGSKAASRARIRSHNIAEMIRAGHPQNQAVAAAYAEDRRTGGGGEGVGLKPRRKRRRRG